MSSSAGDGPDGTFNIEDEEVFSSIFADSFTDERMTSPYFLPYLSYLCASDLSKLNREPERLRDKKASLLQQTRDLAFYNYKTFISTADCSKGIVNDFSVIEEKLQDMMKLLPTLSEHGQNFLKQVGKIGNVRRFTSLTLQRNTELLEILEIPQLMNTCVRNQYYDDALELVLYVKRISKKQQIADIPVIASIVEDVKRSAVLMLDQLLAQLRTSLQLPHCLKVVGYLRRLECFNETELRFKFLQVRNTWFESNLPSPLDEKSYSDEDKVHDYLTKTLEAYRVNLFSIVTQYRAIFSDDSSAAFNQHIKHNSHVTDMDASSNPDGKARDSAIFSSWIAFRIATIVEELSKFLPMIPGRLDSILGQSMYFGQSFSRLGADFRCLIVGVFIDSIESLLNAELQSSMSNFENIMMSHSLISSVSYNQSTIDTSSLNSGKTPVPPSNLLHHQPLCVLVNGVISSFNWIRTCCPVALSVWLSKHLSNSVDRATDILVAFHNTEGAAFSKMEKKTFDSLCKAFLDDVIPHINACLTTVFTQSSLSNAFGPSAFVSSDKHFPKLKISDVMSKIAKISPSSVPERKPIILETSKTLPAALKISPEDVKVTEEVSKINTPEPANTSIEASKSSLESSVITTKDSVPSTISPEDLEDSLESELDPEHSVTTTDDQKSPKDESEDLEASKQTSVNLELPPDSELATEDSSKAVSEQLKSNVESSENLLLKEDASITTAQSVPPTEEISQTEP